MYFVYPPTGKNHIISLNYSQSPFPVDFFYSMNTVQDSDTIFVIANNGSMTQELKTSSYDNTAILSHPAGQLGIQKFQAVLRKGEDRKSLCFMPFWGFLWRDYKDSVMRLNMKPGCWRGFVAMCRNVYNFFSPEKNPGCLLNWVRLRDSCFHFYIENPQTWNNARQTCRIIHGDLIDSNSLHSLRTLPLEKLFEAVREESVDWTLWYKKFQNYKGSGNVRCGAFIMKQNKTEYKECSEEKHGFICQSLPGNKR